MSRRPTVTVVLDGYSSLVRGYGSRDMVEKITGRAPVWSSTRKGWAVQESTAKDVIAIAEMHRCDVVITDLRSTSRSTSGPDAPFLRAVDGVAGDRLW